MGMLSETHRDRRATVALLVRCLKNGVHGDDRVAIKKDIATTLRVHLGTARRWMLQSEPKNKFKKIGSGVPHGPNLEQIRSWIELLIEAHNLTPTGQNSRPFTVRAARARRVPTSGIPSREKPISEDEGEDEGEQFSLEGLGMTTGQFEGGRVRRPVKANPGVMPTPGVQEPRWKAIDIISVMMTDLNARELRAVIERAVDLSVQGGR